MVAELVADLFTGLLTEVTIYGVGQLKRRLDRWENTVVREAIRDGLTLDSDQRPQLEVWLANADPETWRRSEVPPGLEQIARDSDQAGMWWEKLQTAVRGQLTDDELTQEEMLGLTRGLADDGDAMRQAIDEVLETLDRVASSIGTSVFDLPLRRVRSVPLPGHRWEGISVLWPRARVVPFDDRDGLLDTLTEWADGPIDRPAGVAVAQVVGDGGAGKTRLAVELCRRLSRRGWVAGFYDTEHASDQDLRNLAAFKRPRLIVVDYADSRIEQVQRLVQELVDRLPATANRVRVVLLGRKREKYHTGRDASAEVLTSAGVHELHASFLDDPAQRATHFDRSATAIANELGRPTPALEPDLSDDRYRRPLYVQIAALAAVMGEAPLADDLLRDVIVMEDERRWARHLCPDNLRGSGAIRDRFALIAAMSLLPATTRTEQRDVISLVRNDDHDAIRTWLRSLYPDGDQNTFQPVQPDLLAEYLVAHLDDPALYGDSPNEPADSEPDHGPTGFAEDDPRVTALRWWLDGHSLTTAASAMRLTALSVTDFPKLAESLDPVLRNVFDETFRRLRNEIERPSEHVDTRHLANFADALAAVVRSLPVAAVGRPRLSTTLPPFMVPLAAAVSYAEVEVYAKLADDERFTPLLAGSLSNLGLRLSDLGRHDDALQPAQQAVDIWSGLATVNPDRYNPDFAISLNNLCSRLGELGRYEEALAPVQHAVRINTELVAAHHESERHHRNLAMSLTNLGHVLGELRRHTDALVPVEQAVGIYSQLAAADPDRYNASLAGSLDSLGIRFNQLGRFEDAIPLSQHAVDVYTQLAAINPDRYNPNLAAALTNLASSLNDVDKYEDALQRMQHAVDIYTQLANANPDRYNPFLAGSLHNLASAFGDLGHHERALPLAQQAVDMFSELADVNPHRYSPDLALSLNSLGNKLSLLGRFHDAHSTAEQAVDMFITLVASQPGSRHLPDFAMSLNNLGLKFIELERYDDALKPTQQAVDIYTELANTYPELYNWALDNSLQVLARVYEGLGQADLAAEARRRADELD